MTETMEQSRDNWKKLYEEMKGHCERMVADNTRLKEISQTGFNGETTSAVMTSFGRTIQTLVAENAALKEQMTADRKQFLDMRDERDALAQNAERVRVYKQRYFGAIAERDALAGEKT